MSTYNTSQISAKILNVRIKYEHIPEVTKAIDEILNDFQIVVLHTSRRNKCHCGESIDESNPDCVEFRLCKNCAMDA